MVFQRLLVFFATVIDKIATAILPKSWASELRVLVHLAVHPVIGDTHKARLESFYGAQAADYDAFRKRLLQGREQLVTEALTAAGGGGGVWVDLGGGTGANLEMAGDEVVMSFAKVYVVDLCGPLLKVARAGGARLAQRRVRRGRRDDVAARRGPRQGRPRRSRTR